MEHLENSRRTIYIPNHGALHRNMLLIKVHENSQEDEKPLLYNLHENSNLHHFTKVLSTSPNLVGLNLV